MSSKANHVKRSHRSNYKARMFSGSRKSVIKPTVGKNGFMQQMAMIRKFMANRKSKSTDKSDGDE